MTTAMQSGNPAHSCWIFTLVCFNPRSIISQSMAAS